MKARNGVPPHKRTAPHRSPSAKANTRHEGQKATTRPAPGATAPSWPSSTRPSQVRPGRAARRGRSARRRPHAHRPGYAPRLLRPLRSARPVDMWTAHEGPGEMHRPKTTEGPHRATAHAHQHRSRRAGPRTSRGHARDRQRKGAARRRPGTQGTDKPLRAPTRAPPAAHRADMTRRTRPCRRSRSPTTNSASHMRP